MTTEIDQALPSDAGCWIDGHWGQYATARLIEIAAAHGWADDCTYDYDKPGVEDERTATELASAHLASIGPSSSAGITDSEHEYLIEASDAAEEWLNQHVAPEGFSFSWYDGEFFLWSDETWEEGS